MKLLLAAGANPLTANADNTTPLMVAAGVDMWNPGEDGGSHDRRRTRGARGREDARRARQRRQRRERSRRNGAARRGLPRRQHDRPISRRQGRQDRRPQQAGLGAVDDRQRRVLLAVLQGTEAHRRLPREADGRPRHLDRGHGGRWPDLLRLRPQQPRRRATPKAAGSCSRHRMRFRARISRSPSNNPTRRWRCCANRAAARVRQDAIAAAYKALPPRRPSRSCPRTA